MRAPQKVPAIVLGGSANLISVVRSLARAGVEVYSLNHPEETVRFSRYCKNLECPPPGGPMEWLECLLGPQTDHLRGAVLLTCSDEAIELLVDHSEALAERYILEEESRELRRNLLQKLTTYDLAKKHGIPVPGYWHVRSPEELTERMDEFVFPLILKPLLSHHFHAAYGKKYLLATNQGELEEHYADVHRLGIDVVLMEFIPGPDTRLCSYYTYLDADGEPLFHFTKRIIRRFPTNMGGASYHITDWIEEVKDLGLAFFQGVGLRGLGNVEFKLDERDGTLKLIECNARFTAANCLLDASGLDVALLVYNHLTGHPLPSVDNYTSGLRLWNPVSDLFAFRELYRRGEITAVQWLRSIFYPQTFAVFHFADPAPALVEWARLGRAMLSRRIERTAARVARAMART